MRPAFSQAATTVQQNVLGTTLQLCCTGVGYTRNGYCRVPRNDGGNHSVCAIVTDEFLQYSTQQGNDLITPLPPYFSGILLLQYRICMYVCVYTNDSIVCCLNRIKRW